MPKDLDKKERELRLVCEQIGQKASQKFRTARDAFRYVDSDKDGKVTRSEMRYFFLAYNFPKVVADRFFDHMDRDNSGEVDFQEFINFLGPYIQPAHTSDAYADDEEPRSNMNTAPRVRVPTGPPRKPAGDRKPAIDREFRDVLELIRIKAVQKFHNAREVFNFVDINYDGTINRNEMRAFFQAFNLPKEKADAFFDALDEDGSEDVEYMEFLKHVGPYIELPGIAAMMSG